MERKRVRDEWTGPSRRRILATGAAAVTGAAVSGAWATPAAAAAKPPAIFYSPHQDDEAIGLAGSILEHKAAGRPVYLVLVSKGENAGLAQIMNQGNCQLGQLCSAPNHYHNLGWPEDGTSKVVAARNAEFKLSAKAMGVDKVINFNISDAAYGSLDQYDAFVRQIMKKVRGLIDQYPGASHKFAAGWLDQNATHKACSDAAYRLVRNGELKDVRFHHVYAYQQHPKGQRDRGAAYVLHIPSAHMAAKRKSILAYNTWDPSRNLYALGYHSVRTWLEEAYGDPTEFVYTLPADYEYGRDKGMRD